MKLHPLPRPFLDYLTSIDILGDLRDRVKTIYSFYGGLYGAKAIKDIFVSEYLKDDGLRQYESLWFFTDEYVMEAKRFVMDDDFDSAPIKNAIVYWNITKTEYDFDVPTPKSRLNLAFVFNNGLRTSFKASKDNCGYLRAIFHKYVLPNHKTSSRITAMLDLAGDEVAPEA